MSCCSWMHISKLKSTQNSEYCLFFYVFRFTKIATAVTNMGNKDLDKKRLRISSFGTHMDSIEAAQDGDYIKMMLTEYQSLILRLTAIKDDTKI